VTDYRDGQGVRVTHGDSRAFFEDLVARHAQNVNTFGGYVLLQATTLDGSRSSSAGVRHLGQLPYEVETVLSRHYGRVNKMSSLETRVKMSPIEVGPHMILPITQKCATYVIKRRAR